MRCRFAIDGDTVNLNIGTVHANLASRLQDISLHHHGAREFERVKIGADEHVIVNGLDTRWQPLEIVSHVSLFLNV